MAKKPTTQNKPTGPKIDVSSIMKRKPTTRGMSGEGDVKPIVGPTHFISTTEPQAETKSPDDGVYSSADEKPQVEKKDPVEKTKRTTKKPRKDNNDFSFEDLEAIASSESSSGNEETVSLTIRISKRQRTALEAYTNASNSRYLSDPVRIAFDMFIESDEFKDTIKEYLNKK